MAFEGINSSNVRSRLQERFDLGFEGRTLPSKPTTTQESSGQKNFSDTLKDLIGDVNDAQKTADKMAQDAAAGKNVETHNLMIALEKADLQLRTLTAVRNKAIDAYQEIMRMQV